MDCITKQLLCQVFFSGTRVSLDEMADPRRCVLVGVQPGGYEGPHRHDHLGLDQ